MAYMQIQRVQSVNFIRKNPSDRFVFDIIRKKQNIYILGKIQ